MTILWCYNVVVVIDVGFGWQYELAIHVGLHKEDRSVCF